MIEVTEPVFFFGGNGAQNISAEDRRLVAEQVQLRPSKWEDHLGLLAAINRRVAAKTTTVSPWCHASFACVEQDGVQSNVYRRHDEPEVTGGMDVVLFGIDMAETAKSLMDRVKGIEIDPAEDEAIGRRSVEGRK